MKKFNEKNYWFKSDELKKSISDKEFISKSIVEIGEKIINDMMMKKYKSMVEESIDKKLLDIGFREKVIYRSKKLK